MRPVGSAWLAQLALGRGLVPGMAWHEAMAGVPQLQAGCSLLSPAGMWHHGESGCSKKRNKGACMRCVAAAILAGARLTSIGRRQS